MAKAATPIRVRVFFDIDGTLLHTAGAGRVALRSALEAVYGTSGPLDGYVFHGKTDPQIVLELMRGAGLAEKEIRQRLPAVWPVYLDALEYELSLRQRQGRITLFPGVAALLSGLERQSEVEVGLLTGNIEQGARLKLAAAGLAVSFELGGYGSDSEDRAEVARLAVERSRARDGGVEPTVVVVGDTPADVACARAVRANAVAVATGRHGVGELEAAGADAVFEDLSDTAAVLACILSFAGLASSAGTAEHDGDR